MIASGIWRRIVPLAVMLVVTLAIAATAARADFADGARAYDGGDYATAYRAWRALAEAGDAAAQVAIAEMYRRGTGRTPDPVRAALWYRRAAEAGDAVAQMNLGEMYLLGAGVARDPVAAWVWLSRAAQQGRGWAADRRDDLARQMTAEEIARARRQLTGSR